MKAFLTFLLSLLFVCNLQSQVVFSENFGYNGNNGDSLVSSTIGGAVWKAHSGGGTSVRNLKFETAGLSFAGYKGSGIGGAVKFQNTVGSQDANASIGTNINSSTPAFYTSFLLRIDSSGGRDTATDYFFHLSDSSGSSVTNFRARFFVCNGNTPTTFKIGVSKGTAAKLTAAQITAGAKAPQFSTQEYNLGQTYLIILKYTFNTVTTRDDVIDLFSMDATIPATQPNPIVSFTDTAISDLRQIQSVVIRQGNVGRTMGIIDGIYSHYAWSDIVSSGATFNITASAGANGTITPSGSIAVSSGTNQSFIIAANNGYNIQDVLVDGASVGALSTYTFTNVTTTHTIAASFQLIPSVQTLVNEDFVYVGANGDSLTSSSIGGGLWKAHSGGGSAAKNVQFQNTSLNYTGYKGSGLGGSVTFQNTVRSQDVNAFVGSTNNTGSYYASFVLKIDSSGGKDTATDYFFHLCDTSGLNGVANFRSRVFVSDGSTPNTFKIGLSKGTGAKLTAAQLTAGAKAPVFTSTEYNIGQSYLVVMKYTFSANTTKDDNIDLFVLNGAIPATEPAATLSFQDTAISDLKQIQSVVIREGSTGRTMGSLDGIKFYKLWNSIIASGTVYTITASASANGSISPIGAVPVSANANQTFNIAANSGYIIQDVLVDGASVGAVSTYTFNNVTVNHTISASFALNTTTFTITASAGANGSITPNGAVQVLSGTNQTFNIAANSGYGIQDVLVDGSSVGAVSAYTFTNVTITHTISASFKVVTTSGILFEENFVYQGVTGDSLTNVNLGGSIWKAHSGGGSAARNVQFQNSSLSFTNYAGSGLGGSVTFQNNVRSQDVNARIANNINIGSVYTSFLLKIDSSGGKDTATDYFYHFCDTSGATGISNFRCRFFVSDGSTANTFKIGLSKGTSAKLTAANITAGAKAPIFTTTEYNVGQSYLVVMKYSFGSASNRDDTIKMFLIDASIPASEPIATLSMVDTAISDLRQIQSVVIRQATNGRTLGTIDGIKVFTDWSNILPAATTSSISGNVINPKGAKVNKANVSLTGYVGNPTQTSSTGNFAFSNVNSGNYTLKVSKNNDVAKSNGVNSVDALLVQRHILNTTKLNSAYKLIAADVNGDKNINSVDVLRIRRLILGTDTTFNSNTKGNRLWAFVDSAYVFPDTTNPYTFKDSINYTSLNTNKTNQTFIGIKLGDVNYDWNPLIARGTTVNSLELIVKSEQQLNNNNLQLSISTSNFKEIAAMQYTLHFDNTKYEFVGVENNKLNIDFNSSKANETGNIAMLWTDKNAEAKTLENSAELFELILKPKAGIGNTNTNVILSLTNDITDVEAWDKDLNKHNIVLKSKVKNQTPRVENLVVSPNPAHSVVNLFFEKLTSKGQIIVTDIYGKAVKTQPLTQGTNIINIANFTKGTYFVSTITNEGKTTKKLIVE